MDGDGGRVRFHSAEDDHKHLNKGGLSGGLVDGVAAMQVEVVASADDTEKRVSMNAEGGGGDGREKGLDDEELDRFVGV